MYRNKDCKSNLIIFTDLDGTLLDVRTHSYDKALPSIRSLHRKEIPIVFCSSKTRTEQEWYQQKLGIHDPFIVENGGAILIPGGYFPFGFDYDKAEGKYRIIELGIPYEKVRQVLERIRAEVEVSFTGFGDMSVEEVAALTGLDPEAARRAKEREYTETLKLEGTPENIERMVGAIRQAGLNSTHGSMYFSVMGPNDKGRATTILADLFRRKFGQIKTLGLGDSLNDLPMLLTVDIPVLVQKPGGIWEEMNIPRLRRVEGIGPEGWARAIKELIVRSGNGTG